MGAWDVEPFGNDDAADFAVELDDAPASARTEMIGALLERVANATDIDSQLPDGPRAVAAAVGAALRLGVRRARRERAFRGARALPA